MQRSWYPACRGVLMDKLSLSITRYKGMVYSTPVEAHVFQRIWTRMNERVWGRVGIRDEIHARNGLEKEVNSP